jgi:hypothetical protein
VTVLIARRRERSRLALVWPVAIVLVVAGAAYQLAGAHGYDTLFDEVIHISVLFGACVLCLARAFDDTAWRPVALAFGLGLVAWTAGDVLWGILYTDDPTPPYPSAADALWLMYPLTALGFALLIRLQVTRFRGARSRYRWRLRRSRRPSRSTRSSSMTSATPSASSR